MKPIILCAASLLVAALIAASSAGSQEPQPDLGEDTPLVAACNHLTALGEMGGLAIKNCRRNGLDFIEGNRAHVQVRISTAQGPFVIDAELHKSLWSVSAFASR